MPRRQMAGCREARSAPCPGDRFGTGLPTSSSAIIAVPRARWNIFQWCSGILLLFSDTYLHSSVLEIVRQRAVPKPCASSRPFTRFSSSPLSVSLLLGHVRAWVCCEEMPFRFLPPAKHPNAIFTGSRRGHLDMPSSPALLKAPRTLAEVGTLQTRASGLRPIKSMGSDSGHKQSQFFSCKTHFLGSEVLVRERLFGTQRVGLDPTTEAPAKHPGPCPLFERQLKVVFYCCLKERDLFGLGSGCILSYQYCLHFGTRQLHREANVA